MTVRWGASPMTVLWGANPMTILWGTTLYMYASVHVAWNKCLVHTPRERYSQVAVRLGRGGHPGDHAFAVLGEHVSQPWNQQHKQRMQACLLYTSPSPRD